MAWRRAFHAERVKDGVPELEIGGERRAELRRGLLMAGVQPVGDLVDVVADTAKLPEDAAQGLVVGGRSSLGTGSGVSQGGGAEECGAGNAGLVGLAGDALKLFVRKADEALSGALAVPTAARHALPPKPPARVRSKGAPLAGPASLLVEPAAETAVGSTGSTKAPLVQGMQRGWKNPLAKRADIRAWLAMRDSY